MIFNKYTNYKKFSNEKIDLTQLIYLIKDNPLKSKIIKLRQCDYKSLEYKTLKSELTSITPHGTFTASTKESCEHLSGYMYFDIDGFETPEEVAKTINKLNNSFSITFICKSCGGLGLAFLLKVAGIEKDNFEITHTFIRNQFHEKGYNIDKAAGGLIRKWIISYDEDIIYNEDAEYELDQLAYEKFVSVNNTTPKLINKTQQNLDLNDNLESEIIPFHILCKLIKTESEYKGKITGDFIIEEMEYYKIIIPRIIKDGFKHNTYIRIINALYFLNKDISRQEVFSYIFYINSMAENKMQKSKLKALVFNLCNAIEQSKEIRLKVRMKKIHFNPDSDLTKSKKQSMGAKINGTLRSNTTKELIQKAIIDLEANSIKVTTARIAKDLGISQRTVQRNWNKEKIEISSLDFTCKEKEKEKVIMPYVDQLSEFDYVENYTSDKEIINDDNFFDGHWD